MTMYTAAPEVDQVSRVGKRRLVEEGGSDDGDVRQQRDGDGAHLDALDQGGGVAEGRLVREGGDGWRQDVDGHARNHLVDAEGDRAVGVDHVDEHACCGTDHKADDGAASEVAGQKAGEGADGHESIQADVDEARTLGEELGDAHEQQGHGHADGCRHEGGQ